MDALPAMSPSSCSRVQYNCIGYTEVAINYFSSWVHQPLQAVHRIHAYHIHFMYHLREVLVAMSPSSCFRVNYIGISDIEVAFNYFPAGCNKCCRLCITFMHTISISCITYTDVLPAMSPSSCSLEQYEVSVTQR